MMIGVLLVLFRVVICTTILSEPCSHMPVSGWGGVNRTGSEKVIKLCCAMNEEEKIFPISTMYLASARTMLAVVRLVAVVGQKRMKLKVYFDTKNRKRKEQLGAQKVPYMYDP